MISGVKHSYITFKVISKLDEQIEEDVCVKRFGFELKYNKKERSLRI